MEQTEETPIEQPDGQDDVQVYLTEIERLKKDTVPKDQYDKLKKERDEAVHRMATERPIPQEAPQVVEPTAEQKYEKIQQNSREIAEGNLNGLEYAKRLTENNKLMKELNIAPFTTARNVTPDMVRQNEEVNDLMLECIEKANGDPSEYDRLMKARTR